MRVLRTALLSLSLLTLTSSLAFAQGQTGSAAPSGGSGSTAGPTGTVDPLLDLPMDKPDYHAQKPPTPPQQNNPPEDPTDIQKPPTIYGHDLKSKNDTIFYVIDVSGSMGWDMGQYTTPDGQTATGCRLDRAKSELTKSVLSLPSNFKFNMLSYDCDVYQWQGNMVPADDADKQAAVSWINALQPQGATGTGPAVSVAEGIKDNYCIVLLTDGAPNCGAGDGYGDQSCIDAHRAIIKANNTNPAVINVFAIGATDEFEAFCQGVASDNNGTCTDVH
jgi:hypothetical protein